MYSPGVGVSGVVHVLAKRPYIAAAVAAVVVGASLMISVSPPSAPPTPSVPVFWSQK
jgi:hypothetical protein